MCGIAGIIGIDLEKDRSESSCQSMLGSLRHRGPDASGIFHDHPGSAHLAHARLSIIDLSERANQPLHRHERYSIVFNGEIYNYRAIRQKLESTGIRFETDSDTEVILALYEKEGPESFSQLRGMYAFAIWNRRERVCVLARDPFGIKPLYYAKKGEGLVFASEIRAIVASGLVKSSLSPSGLASYLRWGSVDQENPLVEGIESLQPGFYLKLEDGKRHLARFQGIDWKASGPVFDIADFRQAFLDSVSAHLVSDVPVGIFLSGGLDSSSLLAACNILGKSNVDTFTLSFPNSENDEGAATGKIAGYFQRSLTSFSPAAGELPALFSKFLEGQDLPSIDGFNTYCISSLARQRGIKVVLSGLGGDELLGSYPSFQRVPSWTSAASSFSRIPGSRYFARSLDFLPGNKASRLAEFLSGPGTPFRAYSACRSLFSFKEIGAILSRFGLESSPPLDSEGNLGFSCSPFLISEWEASFYMRNQLLRDSDDCSMRHGLELRVPFVDAPLWKVCSRLPPGVRYEKGKRILQKALPELPAWIFDLPKKGFSLPYNQWREGALSEFFKDLPPLPLKYRPTWYQEMALLSLVSWRKKLGL